MQRRLEMQDPLEQLVDMVARAVPSRFRGTLIRYERCGKGPPELALGSPSNVAYLQLRQPDSTTSPDLVRLNCLAVVQL